METDAQARGTPTVGGQDKTAFLPSSLLNENASSHGTAMRPVDNAAKPRIQKSLLFYIGLLVAFGRRAIRRHLADHLNEKDGKA